MAVTEDDLQKKREKNNKLRQQIAEAEATAATRVQEQNNEIEAKSLDAETARLEAQLAAAKEAAKVASVKSGSAGPLEQMDAQLEAARAAADATVGPVDTNAGTGENGGK